MDSSSSSSSSTSSTSALNLAMAALVGASIIAVSAFYIHKRSVDQVIDQVVDQVIDCLIEIRRKPHSRIRPHASDNEEEQDYIEEDELDRDAVTDRKTTPPSRSLDEKLIHYYRISLSLPNACMRTGGLVEEDAQLDPLTELLGFLRRRTRRFL